MPAIPFCKFHGFGNDYIVIERAAIPHGRDISELAVAICNRHTGVGGDGIAVLERQDGERADYFCEIVNPDGSIAGFSGNGTRCAVSYLHYKGLWRAADLRLETRSGVKNYTLIEREAEGMYWFEAEIGTPHFSSSEIPVAAESEMKDVIGRRLPVNGQMVEISAVNVGNPVACVFVDDFDFIVVGELKKIFDYREKVVAKHLQKPVHSKAETRQ